MDRETYYALAKARIERAEDLLKEAEDLLSQGRYKSANNWAFYSIEKSIPNFAIVYMPNLYA